MQHAALTVYEAAQELRVSPKTIRRWISAGTIAAAKVGRSYRIAQEEVSRVLSVGTGPTHDNTLAAARRGQIEGLRQMLKESGLTLDQAISMRAEGANLDRSRTAELGLHL